MFAPKSTPTLVEDRSLPRPGRALAGFALLAVLYLLSGVVGLLVWPSADISNLDLDLFARIYCLQALVIAPVLALLAHFPGQPYWQTLAIGPVSLRQLGFWLSVYAVFQLLVTVVENLIGGEPDEFMRALAGSRHWGLALVVVVLAPLLEEALFRGYLYKAWRGTRLGEIGTVTITALLFTALHAGQYRPLLLVQLLGFAMILGFARARTGLLLTPWLLHAVNNSLVVGLVMFGPVDPAST